MLTRNGLDKACNLTLYRPRLGGGHTGGGWYIATELLRLPIININRIQIEYSRTCRVKFYQTWGQTHRLEIDSKSRIQRGITGPDEPGSGGELGFMNLG